jgi:hypothetical protein
VRILLDECTPRRLRRELPEFAVEHVSDLGWQGRRNGVLLASMKDAGFSVLITVDRNLQFQQNVPAAEVAVVVLSAATNRMHDLVPLIPELRVILADAKPGFIYRVGV